MGGFSCQHLSLHKVEVLFILLLPQFHGCINFASKVDAFSKCWVCKQSNMFKKNDWVVLVLYYAILFTLNILYLCIKLLFRLQHYHNITLSFTKHKKNIQLCYMIKCIIPSGGAYSAWNPIRQTISQNCAGMRWNINWGLMPFSCCFLRSNSLCSAGFCTFSIWIEKSSVKQSWQTSSSKHTYTYYTFNTWSPLRLKSSITFETCGFALWSKVFLS